MCLTKFDPKTFSALFQHFFSTLAAGLRRRFGWRRRSGWRTPWVGGTTPSRWPHWLAACAAGCLRVEAYACVPVGACACPVCPAAFSAGVGWLLARGWVPARGCLRGGDRWSRFRKLLLNIFSALFQQFRSKRGKQSICCAGVNVAVCVCVRGASTTPLTCEAHGDAPGQTEPQDA